MWHVSTNPLRASALLVALSLCMASPSPVAAETLTFIYPVRPNPLYDAARQILREAYFKLGYQLDFAFVYGERDLLDSAAGRADGELARVGGVEREFPGLLRTPVSHTATQQVAFARARSIQIDGWRGLAPYKIVFRQEDEIAERRTRDMRRFFAKTDIAALKMVENRKICLLYTSPSPRD